jgi:hypothetical protein
MRTLPILFKTEMVQALLDGRKSCTRRVIKLPDNMTGRPIGKSGDSSNPLGFFYIGGIKRPPYQPGDILYVRETWGKGYEEGTYIYKADDKLADLPTFKDSTKLIYHPSIHMPKDAARIWLKVTDVRVERLQEITEAEAILEGAIDNRAFIHSPDNEYDHIHTAREHFIDIWNSTIKKSDTDKYGWNANPWVWVIEFERCEKPGKE